MRWLIVPIAGPGMVFKENLCAYVRAGIPIAGPGMVFKENLCAYVRAGSIVL